MQRLQCIDRRLPPLHRGNAFHRGLCCSNRRDGWDAGENGCAANGLLVKQGILPARGVDDELDALALDQVDDIRSPFLYLENSFYG